MSGSWRKLRSTVALCCGVSAGSGSGVVGCVASAEEAVSACEVVDGLAAVSANGLYQSQRDCPPDRGSKHTRPVRPMDLWCSFSLKALICSGRDGAGYLKAISLAQTSSRRTEPMWQTLCSMQCEPHFAGAREPRHVRCSFPPRAAISATRTNNGSSRRSPHR